MVSKMIAHGDLYEHTITTVVSMITILTATTPYYLCYYGDKINTQQYGGSYSNESVTMETVCACNLLSPSGYMMPILTNVNMYHSDTSVMKAVLIYSSISFPHSENLLLIYISILNHSNCMYIILCH